MNYNYYQLYGLILQTTANIAHLATVQATEQVDTTITFQKKETESTYDSDDELTTIYTSYGLATNKRPYLSIWKQEKNEVDFLIIRYNNGINTTFFVSNKEATQLRIFYHPDVAINDVYTYLLGPVIGCLLRLKNKVLLHASVVNINNQAIAFIGEKTAGKSTLIAHLAAKDYPVLSDDIAVLFEKDGQYYVHTGYPRLRLWRKSIEQFSNINVNNLSPVLKHIDKYYLPLSISKATQWNFQTHPLPLKAVIYLQPRNEIQQLTLSPYRALEGFLYLKKNIYADYMLTPTLLAKEFSVIGKVAQQIPILSLNRPNDLGYMDVTCDLITKWVNSNP